MRELEWARLASQAQSGYTPIVYLHVRCEIDASEALSIVLVWQDKLSRSAFPLVSWDSV